MDVRGEHFHLIGTKNILQMHLETNCANKCLAMSHRFIFLLSEKGCETYEKNFVSACFSLAALETIFESLLG